MRAIAASAALALGGLAAIGLLPALVGLMLGEATGALALTVVLVGFLAGATHLALRTERMRLGRLDLVALLVIVWLALPAVAGLPFLMDGRAGLVNAWFEGASAVTTTGATLFPHVDALPRNLVLWLALSQWYGGLVTLVGIFLVLAPAGVGGLRAPLGDDRDKPVDTPGRGDLGSVLRQVLPVYGAATALCLAALIMAGVPLFDALCLAATTLSTGGLLPRTVGLDAYDSATVEFVIMIFMLVGATSVLWLRALAAGRWRSVAEDSETAWLYGSAIALGFVFATLFKLTAADPIAELEAMRHGLFTAASLVSTTGFEVRLASFTVLPISAVAFAMCLGGASFSTAGGMKLFRIGAMVLQSVRELTRLLYPHGVSPGTLGRRPYDLQLMKGIWGAFALFCLGFALLLVVVAPAVGDFEGAFIAAASAMTNTGPVYLAGWTGEVAWPTWIELPAYAKVALGLGMILGRIEVVAVLGLLLRVAWRV